MEAFSQAYYGGMAVGVRGGLGLLELGVSSEACVCAEVNLTKGFGIWEMMLTSQILIPILCICKTAYIFFRG